MQAEITGTVVRNAHPEGCHEYLKERWLMLNERPAGQGFKNVLVIGCSSGFGLASRLNVLRNGAENSFGVCFEKAPNEQQSGSAGWHLDQCLQSLAKDKGRHETLNKDAFLAETKQAAIDFVKQTGQAFDLVVYSVAAGIKINAAGEKIRSAILPAEPLSGLQIDLANHSAGPLHLPAATDQQINDTVAIMGGDDWQDWIETLAEAGALTDNCTTYNYSYLGSELNAAIYHDGTLGAAKEHMHQCAARLREQGFKASAVVCKALVTKASLFIPLMTPYLMALKTELVERGQDEDIFEQMYRLFAEKYDVDDDLIRLDNYELATDVQAGVKQRLEAIDADNFKEHVDYFGIRKELLAMHGFQN